MSMCLHLAQTKLGEGRNRGAGGSREEGEKEKKTFREEREIGSESREKGNLPPCSPPPLPHIVPLMLPINDQLLTAVNELVDELTV